MEWQPGPAYLLLDEITSSLDVESVAAIVAHLHALRGQGVGMLLITHSLAFARTSADHVVFLDRGRVIEAGGRSVLDAPEHARVRQFLQLLEATR